MKKKLLFPAIAVFCILHTICCFPQGTAINNNGATADNSALLDLSSSSMGLLIPRMTQNERNAIVSPALGLQIFNTTTNCFNFWIGTSWKQLCGECDFPDPSAGNNGPVCQGATLYLTAADITGATYQWSGPNGFTSTEQNPVISNISAEAGGSYFVSATLNGCTSQQQSTVVTVNDVPGQPSPISGASAPCEGSSGNVYSVTNVSGVTYTWSVPSGWSITAGQNTYSITVTAGNSSGNISVIPSNICGNGASGELSVSVTQFASGGAETTISGYRIHTFTSSGTFAVNSVCGGNVEVLVAGGGGGAGSTHGGGGGAGGLIYNSSYPVTAGQSISVIVGNGGAGGASGSPNNGNAGGNSVFGSLTANGGGYGAAGYTGAQSGGSGGSGGGGGAAWTGGQSWPGGNGTAGQGNQGGSSIPGATGVSRAGGGGGAGAAGYDASSGQTGNGGAGLAYSISGASTYYAGGGGGGSDQNGNSAGGLGGGGNGAENYAGSSAAANSGGGGGGGGGNYGGGGNGGAGIVIVRYPVP